MRIIKTVLKLFIMLFFAIISLVGCLYVFAYLSSPIGLKTNNKYILLDNEDNIVFKGTNDQKWVELDSINKNMINAIISAEDKNFYHHHGFDYLRIIKTLYNNFINKDITGGASTISQQLVKNMYLDFEKTWSRKIKEAFLTINLEMHYDKDEILTAYLNTVNFGEGNYGIENASKYYFNKTAQELSLEESLLLAGIPKSPANYNPVKNYDKAVSRATIIGELMVKNEFINDNTFNDLFKDELNIYAEKSMNNSSTIMYYQDAVINELKKIKNFPLSLIESGGLKIYTTLDSNTQKTLEDNIDTYMKDNEMQVAGIMINPQNGEVIALTGGKDYYESQYNRVLQAKRQVGSTMKPLLYYCALENGMVSSSRFLSEPTTFTFANNKTYTPRNYNEKYAYKEITMATALSYSDNIFAVKTHLFLGEEILPNYSKKLGITSKLETIPSLPLGTNEITMFEFAQAYQTFASGGYKNKLHFIRKVEDLNGNILYEYKDKKELINNPNNVYILNEMLTSTYNSAFKDYNNPTVLSLSSQIKHKYAIKTGTTDTDFWLVGYNNDALMLVWNGYDEGKNIDNKDYLISRNIWVNSIENYLKDTPNNWYELPKNVIGLPKNAITGEDNYNQHNSSIYYYVKGTQ